MSEHEPLKLEALETRLADEDPAVRCLAAKELGRAGPAAADAVESLTRRLDDADPMVRSMCAAALGKIGVGARSAAGRLVDVLMDPVVPVRFWAADALGRIGESTTQVRDALEMAARDEDPLAKPSRAAARRALARLGEGNAETA